MSSIRSVARGEGSASDGVAVDRLGRAVDELACGGDDAVEVEVFADFAGDENEDFLYPGPNEKGFKCRSAKIGSESFDSVCLRLHPYDSRSGWFVLDEGNP
jgi:hypothetical protein